MLYDPGAVYHCPMILSRITAYEFQPASDIAAVYGSCEPNPCWANWPVSTNVTAKGYWTAGAESEFRDFAPGVYSVIGGDERGALALLHFTVSGERR